MNNQNQPYQFNNLSNMQMNQSAQQQQIGLQSYQINQQKSSQINIPQSLPIQQQLQAFQQQQLIINNNQNRNESLQQNQNNQQKPKIKLLPPNHQQSSSDQYNQPIRQIQDIMQYFQSDRDQFIEPQFRSYLQKDCNIDELKKEYIPRQYQMLELPEITQELEGYIKVRGDGNCFYNTFIYQYLVQVLQKSPDDFQQWLENYRKVVFNIKFENSNPFQNEDYQKMCEMFFQLIQNIWSQNLQIRIQEFQQKYSSNWNYLYQLSIIFCRSIISVCLNKMKQQDKEKAGFYDIAIDEVSIWELDCNYNELVLDSVNKVWKIPIKLFIFEQDSFRVMNYETGNERYPTVFILFRQGHYVIPKIKEAQKTNSTIVSYQQKLQIYQQQIYAQEENQKLVNSQKNEIRDLQNVASILQIELQNEQKKINEYKNKEYELKSKLRDIEGKLDIELRSKMQIETHKCQLGQENQKLSQEIISLKNQNQEYREKINNYQEQNSIQKALLKSSNKNIEELQQLVKELKFQLEQEKSRNQITIQNKISQEKSNIQNQNNQEQNQRTFQMQIEQIQDSDQNQALLQNYQNEGSNKLKKDIFILNQGQLTRSVLQTFESSYVMSNSKHYYQIDGFMLAILIGYLQCHNKYILDKIKKFKPYSDKMNYLMDKFSKQNMTDLTNLNQQFAQTFFEYIKEKEENNIDYKYVDQISKLLDINILYISQGIRKYHNQNSYYLIEIVQDQNKYYIRKIL